MAYAQDTLTSANAANDFVGVLDGLLTTAGWETVETLTPSGNFRNRVYKSPGTSNLCGYDWYLAVCWTTIGTENYVRVFGFESWNTGTKIASGISGGFSSSSSFTDTVTSQPTTGYTTPSTINLGTLAVTTSVTAISVASSGTTSNQFNFGWQTLVPSSAFAYWMSVTLDHVGLWTTVATNVGQAIICSLIMDDDYVADGKYNPHPVVTFNSVGFALSSHFYGVPVSTNSYVTAAFRFSGNFGSKLPGLSDTYFDAFAWRPYVYLTYMRQGSSNPTPATALVGEVVVGRIPDFLLVWGGSIGDTVTVDSATYVLSPQLVTTGDTGSTAAVLVE